MNTRRGKKRFAVYDLTLTLGWEGELQPEAKVLNTEKDAKTVKGKIDVTEFCSTNDDDEWEFLVTVEGKGDAERTLKRCMEESIIEPLKEKLRQYIEELSQQ
mmetsp:Transcript_6672/g.24739  ORF Transcript_6672/g.24739 Transcript_6672/m.24739 type:complete len:102 (+) Transcript_6672:551-856(+)|eukprot:scaffold7979_cov417-Prasinococcus_capsulatus_cf.AAC.17